jgi:N-acetylneuraminic acid mutarotase
MTYDAAAGNIVLFGGAADVSNTNLSLDTLGDTWLWNGSTWTEEFPAASPPPRVVAAVAYDAAAGNVVLFGGASNDSNGSPLGDTWVWNGSTWTEEFPAASPSAREDALMAYDAATKQVVLFGGVPASSTYECELCLNDTWVWNGNTWTEEHPATSPPGRIGAVMAYDAATGQVVLFGGFNWSSSEDAPVALNDTWVWNGSTWTEEFPATSAPDSTDATMAYDAAIGDVVLFGGIPGSAGQPNMNDT